MKKTLLLNLGLLALIGVLVLLVLFEPGIEAPVEPPTLLQLDKEAITRIAIQRDAQQDVLLTRDQRDEWWMEQPIRHRADTFRIDSLLRITALKSLSSFSAAEEKLAAFQLDKPAVTLTLNNDITIAFGGSTPLDQRRYLLLNGKVHLISDTLYYHLIGSFPTFLRKQLLADGARIEALQLPELHLRWQEGRWQLEPQPENFSADQVTRLIDNWKLASALEIKPYDENPGKTITLRLAKTDEPYTLLLTSRHPDLVLARPELGIQYHLDAGNIANLLQLPKLVEEGLDAVVEPDNGEPSPKH